MHVSQIVTQLNMNISSLESSMQFGTVGITGAVNRILWPRSSGGCAAVLPPEAVCSSDPFDPAAGRKGLEAPL